MSDVDFKLRMKQIRPWLDEPLEFERALFADLIKGTVAGTISDMPPFIALHNHMVNIWNIIDENRGFSPEIRRIG